MSNGQEEKKKKKKNIFFVPKDKDGFDYFDNVVYIDLNVTRAGIVQLSILPLRETLDLHRAVFYRDTPSLRRLLADRSVFVDSRDVHGNTALHLACQTNYIPAIQFLLAAGASLRVRNNLGWSCFSEAVSFNWRPTVELMYDVLQERVTKMFVLKEEQLMDRIHRVPDFTMVVDWRLKTWVPLFGRFMPRDTWTIRKRRGDLRLDYHLRAFEGSAWAYGDMSAVLNYKQGKTDVMRKYEGTILNNEHRLYMPMRSNARTTPVEEKKKFIAALRKRDIEALMTRPNRSMVVSDDVRFEREREGWLWNRRDKTKQVNEIKCDVYRVKKLATTRMERVEHMTKEMLKREKERKAKMVDVNNFTRMGDIEEEDVAPYSDDEDDGNNEEDQEVLIEDEEWWDDDEHEEAEHRLLSDNDSVPTTQTLEQDKKHSISAQDKFLSYEQYLEASDKDSHLGKKMKIKTIRRKFKASVSITPMFGLTVDMLIDVLQLLAPELPLVQKLVDFLKQRLPPGFPVQLQFPVAPTVSATVTFKSYSEGHIDPELFRMPPSGYVKSNYV